MGDVGKFILKLLKEKHVSLRALSRRAGVSNSYLSQLTRGLFVPTPEILIKLAPHLGVTPQKIFEEAGWLEPKVERAQLPKGLRAYLDSAKCPADISDEEIGHLASKKRGKQPLASSQYAKTLNQFRERPLYRISKTLEAQPLTVQEEVAKYAENRVIESRKRRRRR
jgi:transcriptional regulator with XRE-family HTH domain